MQRNEPKQAAVADMDQLVKPSTDQVMAVLAPLTDQVACIRRTSEEITMKVSIIGGGGLVGSRRRMPCSAAASSAAFA